MNNEQLEKNEKVEKVENKSYPFVYGISFKKHYKLTSLEVKTTH